MQNCSRKSPSCLEIMRNNYLLLSLDFDSKIKRKISDFTEKRGEISKANWIFLFNSMNVCVWNERKKTLPFLNKQLLSLDNILNCNLTSTHRYKEKSMRSIIYLYKCVSVLEVFQFECRINLIRVVIWWWL